MKRTVRWLALGVFGFLAAPACSGRSGIDDIIGIWNTTSIDGYSVPGTVVYQGASLDTRYVRWVLYDGRQCTMTEMVNDSTYTFDECDYSVNLEQDSITIIFRFEEWKGSVDRRSMSLTDPKDKVWMLRKQ